MKNKMVGNTGSLMTMRFVRNKLRKQEELSDAPTVSFEQQQQANRGCLSYRVPNTLNNSTNQQKIGLLKTTTIDDSNYSNNTANVNDHIEVTFSRTNGVGSTTNAWVFPPKIPTPNLYNSMKNNPIMETTDGVGFKGFRKQFSGRFKRLVTKKTEPAPAIPPELKPQLKTIYVY